MLLKSKKKRPAEGALTGLTELAFRVCFLPAGVHPLELSKLLLGHLGAILVKHDGAPGGFPDFGNLFGGWLLILRILKEIS